MPSKQRAIDHIVGDLAALGVDHIFSVDGANIEDLYGGAHFRSDITAALAKHEFSATAPVDLARRSTTMAQRLSASNAPPTNSRPLRHSSISR